MQLCYIEWVDSHSTAEGTWHTRDSISTKVEPAKSVGWVFKETKKAITLVSSIAPNEYAGDITIPKVAILKRKRIRL